MSLLSMCINLIQEQIVNKFRWMAKELGMRSSRKNEINVSHKVGRPQENLYKM